ncbi:MAG: hydrolase [Ruminiclostridium sp.]|nr:hydrolase [Ruminiclostridium sp.]
MPEKTIRSAADIKAEFIQVYTENIKREGADKLLDYLTNKSDFFAAPASTRYHSAYEGGLAEHSLNVYKCLKAYLGRERVKDTYKFADYTDEQIALVSLLHDICKTDFYKVDYRNAKNEKGQWEKVPYYRIEDTLPYGHGEKSVYMISGFIRLSREEAMAIRWHMGFSYGDPNDRNTIGKAFEMYPLAFSLFVADMEASYYLEGETGNS